MQEKYKASIPETIITTVTGDMFTADQTVEKRRLTLLTSDEPITAEDLQRALAERGITSDRFTEEVKVKGPASIFFQKADAEHRLGNERGDWISIYERRRIFGWRAVNSMSLSALLEEMSEPA